MVYHDEELPDDIQYGSTFGLGFNTLIQTGPSGHEQRIQRMSQGRHRYALIKQLQSDAEAATMKAFVAARRGAYAAFKIKDYYDFTSAIDGVSTPSTLDQLVGTGDGTTTQFQLFKTYEGSGPNPYSRRITKLVSGSVVAALAGVTTTAFTVNLGTGVITFTTAPGVGVAITAGFEFRVPVRFESSVDDLMAATAASYQNWNLSTFGCIEEVDDTEWPDRFWPGGSTYYDDPGYDFQISFQDGTLVSVLNTASGLSAYLPDPTDAPSGAIHFSIWVLTSSTQNVSLRQHDGTLFKTLTPASVTSVGFSRDASGNMTWVEV